MDYICIWYYIFYLVLGLKIAIVYDFVITFFKQPLIKFIK